MENDDKKTVEQKKDEFVDEGTQKVFNCLNPSNFSKKDLLFMVCLFIGCGLLMFKSYSTGISNGKFAMCNQMGGNITTDGRCMDANNYFFIEKYKNKEERIINSVNLSKFEVNYDINS